MTEPQPEEPPAFASLIAAAREGDDTARDDALRWIYPEVQRLVHKRLERNFRAKNPWLRSMFSTGDIVQEVFLGVLSAAPVLAGRGRDAVVGYLATAVQNRLLDMIRHHGAARRDARRRVRPGTGTAGGRTELMATTASPWQSASAHEKLGIYLEVLQSFPTQQQQLLRLRLEQGLPFAAIAKRLDIVSADAARKMFRESHVKLLVRLSNRGVNPESRET